PVPPEVLVRELRQSPQAKGDFEHLVSPPYLLAVTDDVSALLHAITSRRRPISALRSSTATRSGSVRRSTRSLRRKAIVPGIHRRAVCSRPLSQAQAVRPRFPEGLKARATYDTTVFVNDTIHEVLKTLFEAFVLVAFVVFLFLGQLRATIVPVIAVPVSLIGAFMVLVAFGYSANTVSLLAMVLAIGIVVDDAIVVVENVERVMEEEPDLSPADAAKKAMTQVTAPIIGITLVLLSVFVPVAFIAGISGTLFRQFAVTIIATVPISALNALTLSPALCALFLRHSGPRRGLMGYISRGIDGVRDGYALVVRKIVRFSVLGVVLVVVFG